jgi:serine/threonine protein kinase
MARKFRIIIDKEKFEDLHKKKEIPEKDLHFNQSKQVEIKEPKVLLYTDSAKKVISENKGLMKDLFNMAKSDAVNIIKNEKYIIKKVKIPEFDPLYSYGNTLNAYTVKLRNGKKYYIKFTGRNVVGEMAALKYLERLGFNTIPVHFAISVPVYFEKFNETSRMSFIAYDFTNFKTVSQMRAENKITEAEFSNIERRIKGLLNHFHQNRRLLRDISTNNCFIDIKTKKLYLFDPIIDKEVDFVNDILLNKNHDPSKIYTVDDKGRY